MWLFLPSSELTVAQMRATPHQEFAVSRRSTPPAAPLRWGGSLEKANCLTARTRRWPRGTDRDRPRDGGY